MPTKTVHEPNIVLDNGKPTQVIIDITDYEKLLKKAEDLDDLKELRKLKKEKLNFRPLSEVLAKY